MDLSFSGAGFMGCYYFGVVNCWKKYIPRDRVRRVAGASAGSLIAAYYLMDIPLERCLKKIIELTEDVRRRPLGVFDRSNQIVDVLPKTLDEMFPDDAHKRVNGRLYVCMTRLRDMKCVVVNEFATKEELIEALNCSCFIPVWSGNHVSTYKGEKYIDGGFTNNLPVFDQHTIRVSCFSGASDIAPYDRARLENVAACIQGMSVNLTWKNLRRARRALWPPPPSFILNLLERGFHDTKDFILSNDLIQCDRCFNASEFELQPARLITPSISPVASPQISRASSFTNLTTELKRSLAANAASSFRLSRHCAKNKSKGKQLLLNSSQTATQTAPQARNEHQIRIKPGRQQKAHFETNRSKSGKQIDRKALQRTRKEPGQAKGGFAKRLRAKLVAMAPVRATLRSEDEKANEEEKVPNVSNATQASEVKAKGPEIVIQEADEQEEQDDEGRGTDSPSEPQLETILDIMRRRQRESESEFDLVAATNDEEFHDTQAAFDATNEMPQTQTQLSARKTGRGQPTRRSDSISSQASGSTDSAMGSDAPSPVGGEPDVVGNSPTPPMAGRYANKGRRLSLALVGSPSEKYFGDQDDGDLLMDKTKIGGLNCEKQLASSEQGNETRTSGLLHADMFSFAPSPLPSCPPSPSLNRHCTECIRLRQEARVDGLDEVIRRQAELYSDIKSGDPEKEFSTIRWRLSTWFRQFTGPKYSYTFEREPEDADGPPDERPGGRPKRSGSIYSLSNSTPVSDILTH